MGHTEINLGSYSMRVKTNEGGIHKDLIKRSLKGGEREPELLYALRQEINKGMTCMDLGANIGYVTLLMAGLVGDKGTIYAIEPDPTNIKFLNHNIKLNNFQDIVHVQHMGISNKKGEADFYIGKASNLGGMSATKNTKGNTIKVNVDTLTNFFNETKKYPELIKFDVEGHEVEIMEGFLEAVMINKFPCKIVMELHPVQYSETHSLETWLKEFLKFGFKTKYVISAGVPQPDLFKKWGYNPKKIFSSQRGLYDDFSEEHMIQSCCFENQQWMPGKKKYSPKIARFLMIERK